MRNLTDRVLKDLIVITGILIGAFLLFSTYDILESLVYFSQQHEEYEVDEILSTFIVFALCMAVFSWRRVKDVNKALIITENKRIELQQALSEVKTLKGILPICSYCNKIRDDQGSWNNLQAHINTHLDAKFSHGACPDCFDLRMKELKENKA